ncbi:hypothetical protein ACTFIW_003475 [Dictyostelium discoideum]
MNLVQITNIKGEYSIANVSKRSILRKFQFRNVKSFKLHHFRSHCNGKLVILNTHTAPVENVIIVSMQYYQININYTTSSLRCNKSNINNINVILLNSIGCVSWLDKNNDGNREDNNKSLPGGEKQLLQMIHNFIVATIPIGQITVTDSPDLFVNKILTFTGLKTIDRTEINPGLISTLLIVQ